MFARSLPVAAALSAVIAWGAMFPIIAGVVRRIDPFQASAERYGFAALVLLAILALREGRAAFSFAGRGRNIALLGLAGFTGFNIFLLSGVRLAGAEHGALALATVPALVVIAQALRTRTAPPLIRIPFVLAAFAGVALVVGAGHTVRPGSAFGDLDLLAAVMCWVAYTIGAGTLGGWSPLRFTALTATCGAVALAVVAAGTAVVGISHVPSIADLVATAPAIAYLALVGGVYAVFAWNTAVRSMGPQRAALFGNLVPVRRSRSPLSGHAPAPLEIAGGLITVAALAADNIVTSRRARVPFPAVARAA